MAEKICSKCKLSKDISEFTKRTDTGGFASWCKSCIREKNKEKYDTELHWKRYLKHLYNISAEEYYQMLEDQEGGCAICGKTPEEEGRKLAVDHDHACCPGKKSCGMCVRGLLCLICNRFVGNWENYPEVFQTGIPRYLAVS
jgi:hypothetical protein